MLRRTAIACVLAAACTFGDGVPHPGDARLDWPLRQRAHAPLGRSRVIVHTTDGGPLDGDIKALGGTPGRHLRLIGAQVAEVRDAALHSLVAVPRVSRVSFDRPVQGVLERTGATTGANWVRENLGYDGAGIGVAIIDSGALPTHDDLGPERIAHFVDFVNARSDAYDDYGHGTHVAGIIAGTGYDSHGARRGIAPGASLVVLKVLDGEGNGHISDVIAALDYAVHQSYNTDPLTLAARRTVEAGLVVVTAAGNLGRNAAGQPQYGGITSPGNAPWVLTVGASSHMGTAERDDDTIASFSSRGPSYIDYSAKPDIVAPGVAIESLTHASTLLYRTRPAARLWGAVQTASEPYLRMSGTSMAAPVVAGTVALMLQANPALTPNAVKAILQFTAEGREELNLLTQGAGFLNARGAVDLSLRFAGEKAGKGSAPIAADVRWSRHLLWGTRRLHGGMIQPDANAWGLDVTWGSAQTSTGALVVWGTLCDASTDPKCDTITTPGACELENAAQCGRTPWRAACLSDASGPCENIVWGAADENIVWGTACGSEDCRDVVASGAWR